VTDTAEGATDLRVQRSRASIQQALFELTVEKGYIAVTVRDIAQRARVNRSTFYRHYLDKDDLLAQYLDQLQGRVAEAAAHADHARDALPERVPVGLLLLVRHVQEHAAFYRVMLGEHGDQAFSHRFRQLSEQRYRHLFAQSGDAQNPHGPPVELQLQYISAAFVGAMLWWLEHDFPCTAEQFALWLGQLSMMAAGLTRP
jgi:AcrR family transcriptional regulator